MIVDPDTDVDERDFEEVEPQLYGELRMQGDGLMRLNAGQERWIASDLVVKAYR